MREQTFPYDPRVLDRFPGARSYERGEDTITYLAERGGVRYLLIVPSGPDAVTPTISVLEFENEHERATHLVTRGKITPATT